MTRTLRNAATGTRTIALLTLWLSGANPHIADWAAIALWMQLGLPRSAWRPVLAEIQLEQVRRAADKKEKEPGTNFPLAASLVVAFHAGNVYSEEELAKRLSASTKELFVVHHEKRFLNGITRMLEDLGKTGRKYLASKKSPPQKK